MENTLAYYYDKLVEALEIKDSKNGERIRGWSPNNIKSIILGKEFIIIGHHEDIGKCERFNIHKLKPLKIGVNTLEGQQDPFDALDLKEFNCLEDIVVEEEFILNNVTNLQIILDKFIGNKFRFRSVSSVNMQGIKGEDLLDIILKALKKDSFKQIGSGLKEEGLNVKIIEKKGNEEYYTKYNLDPLQYEFDDKGSRLVGKLKDLEKFLTVKSSCDKARQQVDDKIEDLINKDIKYIDELKHLKKLNDDIDKINTAANTIKNVNDRGILIEIINIISCIVQKGFSNTYGGSGKKLSKVEIGDYFNRKYNIQVPDNITLLYSDGFATGREVRMPAGINFEANEPLGLIQIVNIFNKNEIKRKLYNRLLEAETKGYSELGKIRQIISNKTRTNIENIVQLLDFIVCYCASKIII